MTFPKQFLLLIILGITNLLHSQNSTVPSVKILADVKKSFVTYSMTHPMHDWDGTSKEVKAIILYNKSNQTIENVAVSIKISSFDSQNANRDSHMIEVLEAIRYPNVTFTSTSLKPEGNKITILGNLTFHGISKPVSFDVQKEMNGKTMILTGNFSVLMTEYKVEKPSLMGVSTSDVIKLVFHAEFNL
ncbi:MAG: YceI family protein [Bacteroidetes bacterium]|nr:YceI family protein [Bacteroidota bacterium]